MKELAKKQICVQMRSGIEIWIDQEKYEPLKELLLSGKQFLEWEGELFNRADVVGVFKPESIQNVTRRKNGEWQCKDCGKWNTKGTTPCDCQYKRLRDEALGVYK